MKIIRWLAKQVNVLTLLITIVFGLVGWREYIRLSTSKAAVVSSYSTQYSEFVSERDVFVTICRTEIFVSNRGGVDTQVEVLESKLRTEFFPDIYPIETYLVSTMQHHLDISTFESTGIPILTALHNWGQQPPDISRILNFYKTSGVKILKENPQDGSTPAHLTDFGSPVLYGERMNGRYTVTGPPIAIMTPARLEGSYPLLAKRPKNVLIEGLKLEKLTTDHIVLYIVSPDEQHLLQRQQHGVQINFAAHFMGGGRSSFVANCAAPSVLPVNIPF